MDYDIPASNSMRISLRFWTIGLIGWNRAGIEWFASPFIDHLNSLKPKISNHRLCAEILHEWLVRRVRNPSHYHLILQNLSLQDQSPSKIEIVLFKLDDSDNFPEIPEFFRFT